MPLIVRSPYERDGSGYASNRIGSKKVALQRGLNKAVEIIESLEDRQMFDVVITVSDNREVPEWVTKVEVVFPHKTYHIKE